MKELSLYILDITENATRAKAGNISILITESGNEFKLRITDDGCGMNEETLKKLSDPFFTTRTTRKVGLGVSFLKLLAEQTGGGVSVTSRDERTHPEDHGTELTAVFDASHIDFIPMGDMVSTIVTLIQGNPDTDFLFRHEKDGRMVTLDTKEIREVLAGVPLNTYEVLSWITENLKEQYAALNQ